MSVYVVQQGASLKTAPYIAPAIGGIDGLFIVACKESDDSPTSSLMWCGTLDNLEDFFASCLTLVRDEKRNQGNPLHVTAY
jgi:hypothetical protein